MNRTVSAQLELTVLQPARMAIHIGIADPQNYSAQQTTTIELNGRSVAWRELIAPTGGRLWFLACEPGQLSIRYWAALNGQADPAEPDIASELLYLRPSRYCESDRMIGFASQLFRDLTAPSEILAAVSSWVGTQLEYVTGSSGPTDGAVDTLLAGRGVCRDYAHLAVALLRAMQVPARSVAVYAPGLQPMDFHAVAEAFINGAWYVVDATLLAPRESLVRIATGRDAADTSFLSTYDGTVNLDFIEVTATIEGDLPVDDVAQLCQLR